MVMFFSLTNNRIIMSRNKKEKVVAVNKYAFGEITLI